MATKANETFVINAGGAFVVLMHNVRSVSGVAITQASIDTITRRIVDVESQTTTEDSLTVADVIFDEAQAGSTYDWDKTFNFRDIVPATKITARRRHTLQYILVPTSGADDAFRSREVDLEAD